MLRHSRCLAAAIAVVLLVGGSAAVAQSDPASKVIGAPLMDYLAGSYDLQSQPPGVWINTNLELALTRRGTYDLDLNVRAGLGGFPPFSSIISAQLVDGSGNVLPGSQRMINQVTDRNPDGEFVGQVNTTPINERVTISGPLTIRMQIARFERMLPSASTTSFVDSDSAGDTGRTSMRAWRLGP